MPHAVIAANHASFLDGLLLGAFLPGRPIFAVDTLIATRWWARPFLALVDAMPVDPTNPLSIRAMIRAVEGGSACVIFPRGPPDDDRLADEGLRGPGESSPSGPARRCSRCGSRVSSPRSSRGWAARPAAGCFPHPHPRVAGPGGSRRPTG
jgi:hypothetical protein